MSADLAAIFNEIDPPAQASDSDDHFSALPVPSFERHRIAKDVRGAPALLISVVASTNVPRPASIILENLTVQHDVDCRISRSDSTVEEGRFTIVRCTGGDSILHSYFLRIATAMLQSLGTNPSRQSVSQAVSRLAELFHALAEPPRKSTQGLWAELFLIARAHDPIALASAWHIAPEDLYDFSFANQRIEVKSARGRVRRHYFTFEQVHPPAGLGVMIASIFVEISESGTSLLDLIDQIRTRLADRPDLIFRVERVVGLTLGDSWRYALGEFFDSKLAEESLAFYDPINIPKVNPTIPPEVSEIHFRSDLTGQQPAETASLQTAQGIFRAVLRR